MMAQHPSEETKEKFHIIRRLAFLLIVLVSIGGLLGYVSAVRTYIGQHTYDIPASSDTSSDFHIAMTRGEEVVFSLLLPGALSSGWWAIPTGLQITFGGGDPVIILSPPVVRYGGKSKVTIGQPAYFPVFFRTTIPASIGGPQERVLYGRVQGTIVYPAELLAGIFSNETALLNIPVELHLVPGGIVSQAGGHLALSIFTGIDSLILGGLALLFAWMALRRFLQARKALELPIVYFFGLLIPSLFIAVVFLFGLNLMTYSGGTNPVFSSHSFQETDTSSTLLTVLCTVACYFFFIFSAIRASEKGEKKE